MAKNKETATSLFNQMPQLSRKELSPTIKPVESIEEPKGNEETTEVLQPKPEIQKKVETTKKVTLKKEPMRVAEEESSVPLRKDGKKDNRFSEKKQTKKYQMSLQPELFDSVNELAFSLSTPKNKVSFNSLAIEALEDLLKKYKK